jgi:tetratricopeptide (TPR) repeat protein
LASYAALVDAESAPAQDGPASMRALLLDLYQAQILIDLLADIHVKLHTRYDLEGAEELITRLDPILRGQADFAAARASLAWAWYARWRGEQRARWQKRALSDSTDAYRWSNQMTRALELAERRAASTPEIAAALDPLRMEYFWDWPGYVPWLPGNAVENQQTLRRYADTVALYAVHEFSVLSWLVNQPQLADRKVALISSMDGRFDGNPAFVQFQAYALMATGDTKGAEALLRRHVAARPLGSGPYLSYADLLATQGRHREAFHVIESYPGFAEDSGASRVELSNLAGQAAWLFWPTGQFAQARPLLEKSASYDVGSGYTLTSAALIALDDGDPDAAARTYFKQANRYSDLEALNRYFELIFALGRPEEAWRTFAEVHRDGNGGKVLFAIAQGARALGWTDQRTLEWLGSPRNAALADGTFFYAPRAALAASIIDRVLPADLEGVVRSFKMESPYRIDQKTGKIVARPDPTLAPSEHREICGPSRYGGGPAREWSQADHVDSHLVYFARGYQALDRGQYAQAFSALDQAARLFMFFESDCENVSYMLSYLALAAAMVNDTAALQEYLRDAPYGDRNVNYNLALAVIAAIEQRHKDAEVHLQAARNRWTWRRHHALPAHFIYADILERLYQQTKAPLYRDELLRWVRIRQRVQPFEAWPYAKEYQYSRLPADRQRALGMALYLDVQSATLRDVSADEAAAARAALAPSNPFLAWRKRLAPAPASEGPSAAN